VNNTILFAILLTFATPSAAEAVNTNQTIHPPQLMGFECANEIIDSIGLLGRGTDFPAFLVTDVSKELNRQYDRSQLISVECIGEPELKAGSKPILENGTQQDVLTKLSVTFPLQLRVKNGISVITLKVDQNYMVENMDQPGQQQVTQNFIVKK
jgi:hypothetical protein